MAKPVVTMIPATTGRLAPIATITKRKRVAAYARVSTDNDEQLNSFEAQTDYYTKHIKSNPAWEFVEVYTDEGISATSTKNRTGFKRMITDALAGKIDLILTKSVSRFARNTVDTLTTVRELKEKSVEVYFEKENIYTLDSKGELLITIMSSLAQEESRSISENVTWGKRKRFADGHISLPYGIFLGYEKGEDGLPKIVESEAKIIRYIYKLFLEGQTPSSIARILTKEKIPTPGGKEKWRTKVVDSILKNEKYAGNAVLQRYITLDYLTKKRKKNEGEAPQYFVQNSHEYIVSPEIFELAQEEFRRLRAAGNYTSTINCFASRITCGDCGGFYGRKVWHSNDKYRSVVWHCNNKFQKRKYCTTPTLKEEVVKKAFIEAFNSLVTNKADILKQYDLMIEKISDLSNLNKQSDALNNEIETLEKSIEGFIAENARLTINQDEYIKRHNDFMTQHNKLEKERKSLTSEITMQKARKLQMLEFVAKLKKKSALLTEFDDKLWSTMLSTMIVKSEHEVIFKFKDGMELPWTIEK